MKKRNDEKKDFKEKKIYDILIDRYKPRDYLQFPPPTKQRNFDTSSPEKPLKFND